MNTSSEQRASWTVDLSSYAGKILAEQDHPPFDDAVAAAQVGALRSAYVMKWLACAESSKRRFREANVRDHVAGKVVGKSQEKVIDAVAAVVELVLSRPLSVGNQQRSDPRDQGAGRGVVRSLRILLCRLCHSIVCACTSLLRRSMSSRLPLSTSDGVTLPRAL